MRSSRALAADRKEEQGMAHIKPNLPKKICASCARSYAWRKKWARDWEHVRFCSERCRRTGASDGAKVIKKN